VLSNKGNYKLLVSNITPAIAEYTADVEDSSLFDDSFIESFAWKLAAELAQPLTGNKDLGVFMIQMYKGSLGGSQVSNMAENNNQTTRKSSYLQARE
jgi:hypothetical protein